MKNKAFSILTAMMVTVTVCLTGCAPTVNQNAGGNAADSVERSESDADTASQEKPVIKFGFTGGEVEEAAFRAGLDGAEEKFDCTIEWIRYPDTVTMWENLPAQMVAGTAPDIVAVTNENYLEFVENDMFLDLSPYITKEDFDFDRVTDVHKCWLIDDKIYGIPTDGAPAAFIVNMDMWNAAGLGELPQTMEEMRAAAKALTTDEVKGLCLNINEFHLTQYVLSFGGGWGKGETVNTPENAQGLQFLIDMYQEGTVITPSEAGLGWDGEVFAKGLCAMSTGGVWYSATLQELAPDMNYQIIRIPMGTTWGCTSHSDTNVVLSSAKYPELTAKICAYMGRDEAQNAIAELYGNPPAYQDLQEKYFAENTLIKELMPATEYASSFDYPSETNKFTNALRSEMEKALYVEGNEMTGEDILKNIEATMQE